tara:strand:+ start:124 stop:312 length:189 start_codon:yes stop_codon:yes gene_type:complete
MEARKKKHHPSGGASRLVVLWFEGLEFVCSLLQQGSFDTFAIKIKAIFSVPIVKESVGRGVL